MLKQAKHLRRALELFSETVDDRHASEMPSLYRGMAYDGALITAGTRIRWGDVVKKAAVDLWDRAENDPDNAPTLWADLDFHMGFRIIPEVITTSLAFSEGEIGYWPPTDSLFRAVRDGVVHNPAVYPADWEAAE